MSLNNLWQHSERYGLVVNDYPLMPPKGYQELFCILMKFFHLAKTHHMEKQHHSVFSAS